MANAEPYDGAKFGLNKEWYCPSDRIEKGNDCVCDASKHFVKAADSDECVCTDGFKKGSLGNCYCPFGSKIENNQCVREYTKDINGKDIPLVNDESQIYDEAMNEYLNKATGLFSNTCEEEYSKVKLHGQNWCRPNFKFYESAQKKNN